MQKYENQGEIGIFELIDLFRRNLIFIIISVVFSLLIAIILSGVNFFFNREVDKYSLTTNISINGVDIEAEMITLINNSLSHPSILEQAQLKLGITSSDYSVLTRRGNDASISQLVVLGPDSALLTNISNEIFFLGKPLIEKVFDDIELRKLEISSPTVVPQSTQSNVNWIFNSVIGIILGVMISVFYIFAAYFMSPNITQDSELELLLNTKVLGKFCQKHKKKSIRRFFEVR